MYFTGAKSFPKFDYTLVKGFLKANFLSSLQMVV